MKTFAKEHNKIVITVPEQKYTITDCSRCKWFLKNPMDVLAGNYCPSYCRKTGGGIVSGEKVAHESFAFDRMWWDWEHPIPDWCPLLERAP